MNFSLRPDSKKNEQLLKAAYTDPDIHFKLSKRLYSYFSQLPGQQEIVIVCVGTDRSTGDSLGPLVGSNLMKMKPSSLQIYGTLDDPVHAMNLNEKLAHILKAHRSPYIVAVDACLGQLNSVGCVQIGDGPVKPGAGVNKDLTPVGNIHVTGIVNVSGFMEYFVLQNTRLSLVMRMSDIIANAIYYSAANVHKTSATILELD